MLYSFQNLLGLTMGATDGEIGKVKDFYFDDKTWKLRYLVVETGSWLFGRKVLLSPIALQTPDWNEKVFPVNLTKDQIKHSPDIDTDKPVSRQQEEDLHSHYSWPIDPGAGVGFMTTGMVGGVIAPDVPFEERIAEELHYHENDPMSDRGPEPGEVHHHTGDPNLRNFKDVRGYKIHAADNELGEVKDFLVNSTNWNIPFVIAETGNWYSGTKISLATNRIDRIEWKDSAVYVDQTTESLKNTPEFDYDQLVSPEYERNLYNSYEEREKEF
jgi:uncharacterized protein YrrD